MLVIFNRCTIVITINQKSYEGVILCINPSVKVEGRNGPSSLNLIYFEGQQLKIGGGVPMFLFLVSTLGDVLHHALLSLSET